MSFGDSYDRGFADGAAVQAENCRRLAERVEKLERALRLATDDMDWSGGDRDGMPECPWCGSEPETHDTDCRLLAAREALAAPTAPKEAT